MKERGRTIADWPVLGQVGLRLALEGIFRPILRPTLDEFYRAASIQTTDSFEALADAGAPAHPSDSDYLREAEQAIAGLNHPWLDGKYPGNWGVEVAHARFLYALVRKVRPEVFLETGVANGLSSYLILSAMKSNSFGKLVSVDIRNDVGQLVAPTLKDRWELVILGEGNAPRKVEKVIERYRPLDVFFHDSAHTYRAQSREFRQAWVSLRGKGYLLSDDVDSSYAFLDFAKSVGVHPTVLVGVQRVLGSLRKSVSS